MLTRLEVKGFKNLVDIDVHFGPFTCIAGPNGVGKSNLFDVILFLSELANKPFVEAASNIRGGEGLEGLFSAHRGKRMQLSAEMLIPRAGEDAFGQRAEASASFVRYELELSLEQAAGNRLKNRIRLERELLSYIKRGEARRHLPFPHAKGWRDSVAQTTRTTHFISTDSKSGVVHLHADRRRDPDKVKRGGGKPARFPLANLPRTALSSAQNADESRTAVLVRREMSNWRLLQLEPSAMRQPDDFQSDERMTVTGAHLPATLYRVALGQTRRDRDQIFYQIANRLSELVDGVRSVYVDPDEKRQVLTLFMKDRHGLRLPASALSDGTMRFIALAVLQLDSRETGLICLEEPENGIHPQRIDAMLQLLREISVDTDEAIDDENPLRQIIVNTHSPLVAGRVPEGSLLFARSRTRRLGSRRVPELHLSCLDSTWRSKLAVPTLTPGEVIAYLSGASAEDSKECKFEKSDQRRVVDRFHPGQYSLSFSPTGEE